MQHDFKISRRKPCSYKGKVLERPYQQEKNEVWQSICDKVNALGVAKRSIKDVKEKWRAMCGVARKDMAQEKKSLSKTGGGKAPPPPKETSQRIIELIGDEPGFSGIEGGIESGE